MIKRRIALGALGFLIVTAALAQVGDPASEAPGARALGGGELPNAPAQETPVAVDGWIDLSAWQPHDGPIPLDGLWDFYWRELIPPGEEPDHLKPVPIRVPRFWHRTEVAGVDGETTTAGRGFGSYRLRVRLPANRPQLAIRVGNINTAATFFAQGRPIWRAGRTASIARDAVPFYRPGVALLPAIEDPVLEVVVHISSFEASRGGLDDPVWLGLPDDLITKRSRALTGLGLIVGSLLIMALYHLILFTLRRRSLISLYFSLVCLSAAGRLGLSDELVLHVLWPSMPWWLVVKGMYFFAFAIFSVFTLYLEALWPRAAPRWAYRSFAYPGAISALIVLVTPVSFFTHGLVWLETYVVICLVGSLLIFSGAMRQKEAGRWIYAAGFIFVAFGALHDVIVSQGLIPGSLYFGPVGVFVFLLAQSAILAQRFADSLTTVETQKNELIEMVERLEAERRERKRYEELSLAASGLAHETKNPLGIIRGLAQRLVAAPDAALSTKKRAGQILDQADRAASRLGDFLSYARLRDPRIEEVRLSQLLRYAGEVLAPDLEAKAIPYSVDADDAIIYADEEMLLQIVLNLLLNSISASGAGEAIHLKFDHVRPGRGRLSVIDQGAGIPPEILDEVRKPYVTGRADGHGLGLALVERLAELHGWRLNLESRVGEGTRVQIEGLELVAE